MARITVLNRQDVEEIIARYPVGRLLDYTALDGGLANSSVTVDTGTGTYVISVCDEKQMHEIRHLCMLLRYLEEHDFPTARVVAAGSGEDCINWRRKPVCLKRYIEGRVLETLDREHLLQVGATLARLHEIPPIPGLSKRFSYGIESFDELRKVVSAQPFYRWLAGHRKRIASACTESLPRGFVHGDLFVDNMLFVDGVLAAFLDFEEACGSYLVFDIGMSLIGCCCPGGRFSLSSAAALVDGYRGVRELEPEERRALQTFAVYGAVATAFWRWRHYHLRNPDPDMQNHYRAMAAIADQVRSIEPKRFIRSVFDLHER